MNNELKFVFRFCSASMSSLMGNSLTERILYETGDGKYELYSYMGPAVDAKEYVRYKADDELVKKLEAYIQEENLPSYEGQQAAGPMGGMIVVEFMHEGRRIIVNSNNTGAMHVDALYKADSLLREYLTSDNQI